MTLMTLTHAEKTIVNMAHPDRAHLSFHATCERCQVAAKFRRIGEVYDSLRIMREHAQCLLCGVLAGVEHIIKTLSKTALCSSCEGHGDAAELVKGT